MKLKNASRKDLEKRLDEVIKQDNERVFKDINEKDMFIAKLDKNFHVYCHGKKDKLESGEDHKGKFIKLYYDQLS